MSTQTRVLTGQWLGETGKAARFKVVRIGTEDLEEPIITWFPFSQVSKITKTGLNDELDTLEVTTWILNAKGIEFV